MITVQNHFDHEEIFIMDDNAVHDDIVIHIDEEGITMTQTRGDGVSDVLILDADMLAHIFIALQLSEGIYDTSDEGSIKQINPGELN